MSSTDDMWKFGRHVGDPNQLTRAEVMASPRYTSAGANDPRLSSAVLSQYYRESPPPMAPTHAQVPFSGSDTKRGLISPPLSDPLQQSAFRYSPNAFSPVPLPYAEHRAFPKSGHETRPVTDRQPTHDLQNYPTEALIGNLSIHDDAYDTSRHGSDTMQPTSRFHTRRRPYNCDEFDGPTQLLPLPLPEQELARSQPLSALPVHLTIQEQDDIVRRVNNILSQCAFHFVARYQFPIPVERDKPRVQNASDRDWTEWAYLLKRLATKRRIPARVVYDNQIKQFVTTLENSIATRQSGANSAGGNSRNQQNGPARDDRYILQLISAGTQVAKILMDSQAMEQLSLLYTRTESVTLSRRSSARLDPFQ